MSLHHRANIRYRGHLTLKHKLASFSGSDLGSREVSEDVASPVVLDSGMDIEETFYPDGTLIPPSVGMDASGVKNVPCCSRLQTTPVA